MSGEQIARRNGLRAVAAVVAGLAAAACVTTASAEPLRVGKSTIYSFTYTLVDVGVRSGIFKKHGLDVVTTAFGGGPRLIQAMTAGAIDIGLDGGTDMALIAKGAPMLGIAPVSGPPTEMVLTVRADSPLKTVDDIRGKKVAVTGLGTLTGWITRELARKKGWGDDGIKLVLSNSIGASRALLRTGEVDAVTTDITSTLEGQRKGAERLLFSFGDVVKDFHMQIFFATNDAMKKRPDDVRAFLAGWYDTLAFAKANKQKTIEIEHEVLKFDPGVLSQVYDRVIDRYPTDGKFNPAALAVLRQSYVDMKLLPTAPDMSKLYTEEFIPKKK
jgi:ABC-type nitrate/sulfonate/bicarbonate transport system substrate-binding protein